MSAAPTAASTPREPRQERSRRTVRQLLREAEGLLRESGPQRFSMITLAARAGVNRSTAYAFFPSKYAVFNALAQRYLDSFLALIAEQLPARPRAHWSATTDRLIALSATLYNREPTARILFLGGAVTPEIESAHHQGHVTRMAAFMRERVEQGAEAPALRGDPDPYRVAVEAVIAVFAMSQRSHGEIRPAYIASAQRLMRAFLDASRHSGF